MGLQVITEYRKARRLMSESAASPKGGVWQSLFQEVEKVQSLPFCCSYNGAYCSTIEWHVTEWGLISQSPVTGLYA